MRFLRRDQHTRTSIGKYRRLTLQMFLDLRCARRRIDRYGYATGQQYAAKADKEVLSCRQHQGNTLSGFDAVTAQRRSDDLGSVQKFAVGQRLGGVRIVVIEMNMDSLRLLPSVPFHCCNQRRRIGGYARARGCRRQSAPNPGTQEPMRLPWKAVVRDRRRFPRQIHPIHPGDVEAALHALQQLDAGEAVYAGVPFQCAGAGNAYRCAIGIKLSCQFGDQIDQ